MDVENVSGKGFATGRTAEQQGKFSISTGMMGEIVVNNQNVSTRLHEIFGNAGCGVRCNIGKAGRVIAFCDNDHSIIHRPFIAEIGHNFGYRRSTLSDGAIDTKHILALLVKNGVKRNSAFARLPVAENQFALAASDGNKRIDDDNAALKRHRDGRTVHDVRGRAFDGQALACI